MTTADLHPDTGVPRPGTCCGACPPIAGGGWDCTCEGNARCPAAMADAGLGKSAEAAALAARLAAVEALADEWERELDEHRIRDENARYCWAAAAREVRAALAAPTDTTKETP